MQRDEFEKLVSEAIDDLPEWVKKKLSNVAVVVEDVPSEAQLKKGLAGRGVFLLGLYEGVPQTKRGLNYTLVLPDKISIFQRSIEQVARTPDEIREAVRETVWHEFAHHFGFDEDGVRKLSRKRKK